MEYLVRIKQFSDGNPPEEGGSYDYDSRVEATSEKEAIENAMVAGEPEEGEVYEVTELRPKLVRIKSRKVTVRTTLEEVA